MREAEEGRPIHSPKVLESKKRVAEIRTNSGKGNLPFFISRYLSARATFLFQIFRFQILATRI
jgi:hypothetical protein